jgi:hypothetical protein
MRAGTRTGSRRVALLLVTFMLAFAACLGIASVACAAQRSFSGCGTTLNINTACWGSNDGSNASVYADGYAWAGKKLTEIGVRTYIFAQYTQVHPATMLQLPWSVVGSPTPWTYKFSVMTVYSGRLHVNIPVTMTIPGPEGTSVSFMLSGVKSRTYGYFKGNGQTSSGQCIEQTAKL